MKFAYCNFLFFFFVISGSPHLHILHWLSGVPNYVPGCKDSEQKVIEFIDKFITCKKDPSIPDLLKFMYHKHTRTCTRLKNGKKTCRFGFFRMPMRNTCILHPLDPEMSKEDLKKYQQNLNIIKLKTEEILKDKDVDMSFDDYLKTIGFDENDYLLAIRSELQRVKVFLRRDISEAFINNYNKELLLLHGANIDLQYILNAYSCVTYVVDYMQKSDKGMSKLLHDLQEDMKKKNSSAKDQMKAAVHLFVNKSETCNQEIDYHLLSMHLSECSRKCQYINTSPLCERSRMLKSSENLQFMSIHSPDSTEIFVTNIIEYYIDRPESYATLSLADFVANFNLQKSRANVEKKKQNDDENDEDEIFVDESDTEDNNYYREGSTSNKSQGIKLNSHRMYMIPRKIPKIIRFRNYKEGTDPYNFYREQLMLFTSWKNEDECNENVDKKYNEKQTEILTNRNKYFFLNMQSLEELEFENFEEDFEDEGESTNLSKTDIRQALAVHDPAEQQTDIRKDLSLVDNYRSQDHSWYRISSLKTDNEYFKDIYSLNDNQYKYLLGLMHHLKCYDNDQLLHFISGYAGTGKSKLIGAISECVTRYFISQPNGSEDQTIVLKAAFMARQAFLIEGYTLHHTFALPLSQAASKTRLDSQIANELRVKYRYVKILIIDEISLVGQKNLMSLVQKRLQHIFNNQKLYGGLHVLCFGDLNQLSPVADKWIFDSSSPSGIALWQNFKLFELTEIMRQKDDAKFATALCHYAKGLLSEDDLAMFQGRNMQQLKRINIVPPHDALHLFCTNDEVDNYNAQMLNKMTTPGCIVKCTDICNSRNDRINNYCLEHVKNLTIVQTNGLRRSLNLKIGARYMLSRNLDQSDGLCNGVLGLLKQIMWGTTSSGEKVPSKLLFLFENENVGRSARKKWSNYIKSNSIDQNLTPIERIDDIIYSSKDSNTYVIRSMFPVAPAMGLTIHKSQGITTSAVVIHPSKHTSKRHWYVAMSRVTNKNGLFIDGTFTIPPKGRSVTDDEMNRMRQDCKVEFNLQFPQELSLNRPYFIFHNSRSINKHKPILSTDKAFLNSTCIMIEETRLTPNDAFELPGFHIAYRKDCLPGKKKAFGSLLMVNKQLTSRITMFDSQTYQETKCFLDGASFLYQDNLITFLHKGPKYPTSKLISYLQLVMNKARLANIQNFVFLGDFNVNFLASSTEKNELCDFMNTYQLKLSQSYFATTDNGTMIDLCFSNIPTVICKIYESITSDHKPIWFTF